MSQHETMCLATVNNSTHWSHSGIPALCFIPYCGHITATYTSNELEVIWVDSLQMCKCLEMSRWWIIITIIVVSHRVVKNHTVNWYVLLWPTCLGVYLSWNYIKLAVIGKWGKVIVNGFNSADTSFSQNWEFCLQRCPPLFMVFLTKTVGFLTRI